MNKRLKNTKDRKASKAGFTLGELLIAVAIIGILVAVSIPLFFGYMQKSKETVCLSNRAAARRLLLSEQILSQGATLQEVSETDAGKKIMSQFKCPSGGRIYVEGDAVKCTVHNDGTDTKDPFATLSASEKAGKFIDLATELGTLSHEILGEEGDGSIKGIEENIKKINETIQSKKQELTTDKRLHINQLAEEINEIAAGLDGVSASVQEKIAQLGPAIDNDGLVAAGTYKGIIDGYVKAGATQAAGEEAADKQYPGMRSTLNANLPTLNQVNEQLADCKDKITEINQKLSEINELLKDK